MNHKDLDVWKAGIELALQIYEISKDFPREEIYSLTSQIRRAGISIPSNIAEGAARSSDKEFVQFLYVALGSLAEVETQVILAEKLSYLSNSDDLYVRLQSTKQMLIGLIKYLKNKSVKRKR
jgi:four helix bundle protein